MDSVNKKKLLIKRDGMKCYICGKLMEISKPYSKNPYKATIDHIIPKSGGGTNHLSNLKLAHSKCNNERSNDIWEIQRWYSEGGQGYQLDKKKLK